MSLRPSVRRRTVPSPYGERGKLPFKFALSDDSRLETLESIPGVRVRGEVVHCTWDAQRVVAEIIGAEPHPEPALPRGFWRGRERLEELGLLEAIKSRPYQPPMVDFLGRRDWGINGDDMQMGKTAESLAAVTARGAQRLICVVPGFARMVWVKQVQQWLQTTPLVLSGRRGDAGWFWRPDTRRREWVRGEDEIHQAIRETAVTISNFDILQAQTELDFTGEVHYREDLMGMSGVLYQHWWDAALIDEIHLAAGWQKGKTLWTRSDLIELFLWPQQCAIAYGLSGTTMTGDLTRYWAQMRIIGHSRVWGVKPFGFQVRYCNAQHRLREFKKRDGTDGAVEYWDASGKSHTQELKARVRQVVWGRKRQEVSHLMPKITRQIHEVDIPDDRRKLPTPPKRAGGSAIKRAGGTSGSQAGGSATPGSRVMAYARQNIRIIGPVAVKMALEACAAGYKVALFTRYHESREHVESLAKAGLHKYGLPADFLYLSIHGRINSDTRVAMCERASEAVGPVLVVANMDAMPGGVQLRGTEFNYYVEPHDKIDRIFQSEARAAQLGAKPITSVFFAVPGTYSEACYERLLPKLKLMDEVADDSDARDLVDKLQKEYNDDLESILASYATAVRPGMLDVDGES